MTKLRFLENFNLYILLFFLFVIFYIIYYINYFKCHRGGRGLFEIWVVLMIQWRNMVSGMCKLMRRTKATQTYNFLCVISFQISKNHVAYSGPYSCHMSTLQFCSFCSFTMSLLFCLKLYWIHIVYILC